MSLNHYRSRLARLRHQPSQALDFARESRSHARQMEDIEAEIDSLTELTRAFLLYGDMRHARETLLQMRLSMLRDAPRLLLDYHLAGVRQAAGLEPVDDEYATAFPLPDALSDEADRATMQHHIRRARLLLRVVASWAQRRDSTFDCHWRQDEVNARRERLNALASLLTAG